MGLRAFRGNPFEHTHENKAFDSLFDLLDAHCTATSQNWLLLGNFFVGSRELDALVIKPNAVIIIDFKDFSGDLKFSESGPWLIQPPNAAEPTQVKGGSSVNPLVQLRINKKAVMDFLSRNFSELNNICNWGHAAALVAFHGNISFDSGTIPGSIKPWFYISDFSHVVRDLEAIVSREIHFTADDMNRLASLLGLESFVPAGGIDTRKLAGPASHGVQQGQQLTRSQAHALTAFSTWRKTNSGMFRLLGMASTGKRFLFPYLVDLLKQEGLDVVLLTPSARLSANYANPSVPAVSIYTWLYELIPSSFEKVNDRKFALHKVNVDLNLDGKIPVLVDAHLMSDEEFEVLDRRYGSGRLVTDFLTVMKNHNQPFIVIGDQYQLTRGSLQRSLTSEISINAMGQDVVTHVLNEQILADKDDALNSLQAHLVGSIDSDRFNRLPRITGHRLETLESDSARKWEPDIHHVAAESIYLCATHLQTSRVNGSVKTRILGHKSPTALGCGDRVDFHSRTPILEDEYDPHSGKTVRWINAGEIGLIDDIDEDIETYTIELRGRKAATVIRFQRAKCRVPRLGQVTFRYLVEFYEAEEPEISVDQVLALQVLSRRLAKPILDARKNALPAKDAPEYKQAKLEYDKFEYSLFQSQGYVSAARIRPAHALTLHRAQGRRWPSVWISAARSASSETPNNQEYFRWLYTASVCADELLVIRQLPFLNPLTNAAVSRSSTLHIGSFPIKQGLHYDKARQPTEREASLPMPAGFSDIKLLPLLLELMDRLSGSAWAITVWREHVFQVVLTVSSRQADAHVQLRLHYDKSLSVSNVTYLEGSVADRMAVGQLLIRPFKPADSALAEAVDALTEPLQKAGFTLVDGKETAYRAQLVFSVGDDGVELEVNANKEGMISSLRVIRATTEEVIVKLEQAIKGLP